MRRRLLHRQRRSPRAPAAAAAASASANSNRPTRGCWSCRIGGVRGLRLRKPARDARASPVRPRLLLLLLLLLLLRCAASGPSALPQKPSIRVAHHHGGNRRASHPGRRGRARGHLLRLAFAGEVQVLHRRHPSPLLERPHVLLRPLRLLRRLRLLSQRRRLPHRWRRRRLRGGGLPHRRRHRWSGSPRRLVRCARHSSPLGRGGPPAAATPRGPEHPDGHQQRWARREDDQEPFDVALAPRERRSEHLIHHSELLLHLRPQLLRGAGRERRLPRSSQARRDPPHHRLHPRARHSPSGAAKLGRHPTRKAERGARVAHQLCVPRRAAAAAAILWRRRRKLVVVRRQLLQRILNRLAVLLLLLGERLLFLLLCRPLDANIRCCRRLTLSHKIELVVRLLRPKLRHRQLTLQIRDAGVAL
mmetsp:Transcript_11003/g.36164  ORF Transcript_11003/g.36164 Transcript_11003/m.36164 type:complete len:418 (-) Transcript_11003:1148-2401(-)